MGCGSSAGFVVADDQPDRKTSAANSLVSIDSNKFHHGKGHLQHQHSRTGKQNSTKLKRASSNAPHSSNRAVYEVVLHRANNLPPPESSIVMDVSCSVAFPGVSEKKKTKTSECTGGDPTWEDKFVVINEDELAHSHVVIGKVSLSPSVLPLQFTEVQIEQAQQSESMAIPTLCLSLGAIPDFWNMKSKVSNAVIDESSKTLYVPVGTSPLMLGFHFASSHCEVILHETSSNWKTLMTQLKWNPLYHFTYEHERRDQNILGTFNSFGTLTVKSFPLFAQLSGLHVAVSSRTQVFSKSLAQIVHDAGIKISELRNPKAYNSSNAAFLDEAYECAYIPTEYAVLRIPLKLKTGNTHRLGWLLLSEFSEKSFLADIRSDFLCIKFHTEYEQPRVIRNLSVLAAVSLKDLRWEENSSSVFFEVWQPSDTADFALGNLLPLSL